MKKRRTKHFDKNSKNTMLITPITQHQIGLLGAIKFVLASSKICERTRLGAFAFAQPSPATSSALATRPASSAHLFIRQLPLACATAASAHSTALHSSLSDDAHQTRPAAHSRNGFIHICYHARDRGAVPLGGAQDGLDLHAGLRQRQVGRRARRQALLRHWYVFKCALAVSLCT